MVVPTALLILVLPPPVDALVPSWVCAPLGLWSAARPGDGIARTQVIWKRYRGNPVFLPPNAVARVFE